LSLPWQLLYLKNKIILKPRHKIHARCVNLPLICSNLLWPSHKSLLKGKKKADPMAPLSFLTEN